MDMRLIRRLVVEKLRDRSTYVIALVVGTLINLYGQLFVQWMRGSADPLGTFVVELQARPLLTSVSIFIAYAFPFCVGIYSAVASRYRHRRIESIADFPERKPDPVFRATPAGRLVEVGATTRAMFERYGIDTAQKILGEELWARIVSSEANGSGARVFFAEEGAEYVVSYARTANDEINVYLSRMSG
jgi:hypothetical protein